MLCLNRVDLLVTTVIIIIACVPAFSSFSVPVPSSSGLEYGTIPQPEHFSDPKPLQRTIRSTLSKPKKKKVLQVSKRLFNKIKKNKHHFEKEVEEEEAPKKELKTPAPIYKAELYDSQLNHVNEAKRPIPDVQNLTNPVRFELPKVRPTYDCPGWNSGVDRKGKAIVKGDPSDCACYYYCNWGIRYVQCCSWPLLWNDEVKACDWYWKAECRTYIDW